MSNQRFRKTEYAILIAYFKLQDYPSAKRLAKNAGISRSTFYRHHKRIQSIPLDYEAFLLQSYIKSIKSILKKNANLKTVLLRTLVFITSNREAFRILFLNHHQEIIKKMFDYLKPRILAEWHLPGNLDIIYRVYQNGVLGVIEFWYRFKFSNQRLEPTLNDILYLTNNSRRSLLPLQ